MRFLTFGLLGIVVLCVVFGFTEQDFGFFVFAFFALVAATVSALTTPTDKDKR